MTSLVRLSMPGAVLFFISVRVFLTSYVMIGGTSDEFGLAFFSVGGGGGGGGVLVLECRIVQFCVKACADLRYFIYVCLYFIFFILHFTYLFLWPSFVYMIWSPTTLKYSFNLICSFLS